MSQQTTKGARIHAQLAQIMSTVEAVGKERRNSGQGFDYRGIQDVMDALHPIFAEHKVFILSEVMDSKTEERATMKGGTLIYRVLQVKVSFVSGEDGSRESVVVVGEGMDSGDKAANKAMSAALKYALTQTLILPYGQVDADADTPPPSRPGKPDQAPAAVAGEDPHATLFERMAADGISNIEMVRYCQRKGFLAEGAGPSDLDKLAAPLLKKMLSDENWAQVKGAIAAQRPPPAAQTTPAAEPAPTPGGGFDTLYIQRVINALALVGITPDELTADLRRKGIITANQTIENLPAKVVDVLLDGKDKTSGRDNWDIVVDRIKKARTA